MIERTVPWFGRRLVFDRDAIVRAALRAYVESFIAKLPNCLGMPAVELPSWTGDLQRGALLNEDGCGGHDVVAWTDAGVVGLALDGWQGPIEQLGLSIDAVTGGPDDVRGAVPGLPEELEPAFVMAVGMLGVGNHGEKLAGAGFWLCGDRGGGTLFTADRVTDAWGVTRLAVWGLLRDNHGLPHACSDEIHFYPDHPADAPLHAIVDAVVERRLKGPTELTADELATLVPNPSDLESLSGVKQLLGLQRMLQKVGITWPGSPSLPELLRLTPPDRSVCPATSVGRYYAGGEYMVFDRDPIVHAALCAYVENIFTRLDPLERHRFPTSIEAKWTGNPQRGAFYNGDDGGHYDVVAWTEAGVVGLAYETGFGPIERFGLAVDAVTGGPDDVRAALPELPAALEPALALAVGMLPKGLHGEKLAGVGFWLHNDRVEGTLFHNPPAPPNYLPPAPGVNRLKMWGHLRWGWLLRASSRPSPGPVPNLSTEDLAKAELDKARAAPIQTMVDVVVDRALRGPTDLLPDELAMLFPTPPDPSLLQLGAQRLEKVGITWRDSPELPAPPATTIGRTHRLGYLVFDRKAIVRAALRAYVEKIFTWVDPAERHGYPVCDEPSWTGDLQRGAFLNDNDFADNVVAWTEAGVVGLAYESGFGPIERFGLSVDAVTGGPDDVRAALPELPAALESTLDLAVGMLPKGALYGEKLAGVGFWQHGDRVAGTLFDDPTAPGVRWLAPWGMLLGGRRYFRISQDFSSFMPEMDRRFGAPIHALVDAVVDRALTGPTELTTDELATLLPVPIDLEIVVTAQRKLQKVGITWPGSPEIPPLPM